MTTSQAPMTTVAAEHRFPDGDGIYTKCILCIVFAVLSFIGAACVLTAYVRLRHSLRRPILDCLVLCIALALPGSINLIVSAALRRSDPSLHGYCRWSFYFYQQFTLANTMMEACFFAAIVWTLAGGTVTTVGVRRMFALVLLVACFVGTAPIADLAIYPPTGTELGSSMPWCWLPEFDMFDAEGQPKMTQKLVWFKFAYGYAWALLTMVLGIVSCVQMLYLYQRSARKLPPAVKWRLLYSIAFMVCWITSLIPRVAGNTIDEKHRTYLEYVLAIVAPGMPFLNSVLFFALEAPLKAVWASATAGSDAQDGGIISSSAEVYDAMVVHEDVANESVVLIHTQGGRDRREEVTDDEENEVDCRVGMNAALNRAVGRCRRTKSIKDATEAEPSRLLSAAYDDAENMWVVDLTKTRFDPDTEEGRVQQELIKDLQAEADKKNQVVQLVESMPKPPIGVALSFVGGYCDACGFVSMDLFTAHVTGNIVLIGAHIGNHKNVPIADLWPKVAAIPIFITAVAIAWSSQPYVKHWHRRFLLGLQLLFFFISFCVAKSLGPFETGHAPAAWAAGQFMVAGMAIQNSYQRTHLVGLPMTTFMTGNTNQIVHDVIEVFKKRRAGVTDGLPALYKRIRMMVMCWVAFITGCMFASVMYKLWGMWCYLPPVLSVAAIIIAFWDETAMQAKKN